MRAIVGKRGERLGRRVGVAALGVLTLALTLLSTAVWRAPARDTPDAVQHQRDAVAKAPPARRDVVADTSPLAGAARQHSVAPPLEPSGSEELSGAVIDALGGPVPFALVTLHSAGGAELGATTADAQGRFGAHVPPGDLCLQARAEAFARATRCLRAPALGVELVLAPAAAIVGRVVAASSGQGVNGVGVMARAVSGDDDWVGLNQEAPSTVVSGSDGSFRIDELRGTGAYELVARSERWRSEPTRVELDVGETTEPVLLELSPATSLSAVVLRADEPCSGAEVALSGPVGVAAQASAAGVVRVEGLPSGRYRARVYCPRALLLLSELELGEGTLEHRWDLDPGLSIAGRVLSPRGEPVAGARVSVEPVSFSEELAGVECTSETDGEFSCSGLRAGEYECSLVEPGDPSREVVRVSVTEGDPPRVVLHQRPQGTLIVTLAATAVSRPDAVQIFARGPSGFPVQASVRHDELVLEDLPLGFYQVYAELPSAGTVAAELTHEDQVVRVELAVPALSAIEGRVVDADGAPLVDTWVVALPAAALARPPSATYAPALTDEDGAFTLPRLAPGQYHLRAQSSHGVAEQRDVAAGETGVLLRALPEPTLASLGSRPVFGWVPTD